MRVIPYLIYLIAAAAPPVLKAGEPLQLSLDEAVTMARVRSVDAAVALDELRSAYWEWRTFKANQLPEISFEGTLPSYSKAYTSYMNDNGDYSFVGSHYLDASGKVSVSQQVRLTGATLSLNSSLDYLRQFGNNGSNRFLSIPVALSINQPLLGVNSMKWNARIEPVRFAEAKAAFLSATEDVAHLAVTYYFDLMLSGENLRIARQNLDNAERLYSVAVEKRKMGQISENDLLQMELNVLDAKSNLTDCSSSLKSSMFALSAFLDLDEGTEIEPTIPPEIPGVEIEYSSALEYALANNKFAKNLMRRQLEADYEVARAKGDLRQINLFIQLGFTGTDTELSGAYNSLRGNQVASIGVKIPLVDWGKRRGRVKVAESNRRVTESTLRRESMDFNRQLFILVERFSNQREQLDIARHASEIADRRYNANVETYLIGRISTLDLNDSQSRKDESRRQYIKELYKYWSYWYQLRSITLHDYATGGDINADIARLLGY